MFIRLNDENKTVISMYIIEYVQKRINYIDNSYIKIGISGCKEDLLLEYRDNEKLSNDYDNLTKRLEESYDLVWYK